MSAHPPSELPKALLIANDLEFAGRFGSETELQAATRRHKRNEAAAAELRKLHGECEALREALESIRQYGSDTLSGRTDGPDDRKWQRDAVLEMRNRARAALSARTKDHL